MRCKWVSLGEVVGVRKETVVPKSGWVYRHYSLPAFDAGRLPVIEDGDGIRSNKLSVHSGDVLCNKLNMRFKRIWRVDECGPDSVCSTEFVPLIAESIDRDYLYYLLLTDDFTQSMIAQRSGTSSSHQRIRTDQLLSYEFALPDFETQKRVSSVLLAFDGKIALNSRINDHLAA